MNARLISCVMLSIALGAPALAQPLPPGGPFGAGNGSIMDQRLRDSGSRRAAEPARRVEVEAWQSIPVEAGSTISARGCVSLVISMKSLHTVKAKTLLHDAFLKAMLWEFVIFASVCVVVR